jgi:hypothetical protein
MKAILGVALICQRMNKTKPRRSVGYVHIPVAQHFSGKGGSKSQGSSPLKHKTSLNNVGSQPIVRLTPGIHKTQQLPQQLKNWLLLAICLQQHCDSRLL